MSAIKRKQTDSITPPQTTRFTRRRFLSKSMSDIPTDSQTSPSSHHVSPSPMGQQISPQGQGQGHQAVSHYEPVFPQVSFVPSDASGAIDITGVIMSLTANPTFARTLASVMVPTLTPILTASITESLKETLKTDLSATVNAAVASALQPLKDEVDAHTSRIDTNESNIASLQDEHDEIYERISTLESGLEELEQYGRRNYLCCSLVKYQCMAIGQQFVNNFTKLEYLKLIFFSSPRYIKRE